MRHVRTVVVALALLALADAASAVTKDWTNAGGTGNGLWTDPLNWNPNGVPAAADSVVIGSNLSAGNCTLNTSTTVAGLTILNPGTPPTLTVTGSVTLTVTGATSVGAATTLSATSGAIVNINGGGSSSGQFSSGASSIISFGASHTANAGSTFAGPGEFRITGGLFVVPSAAGVSIPNLRLSGGSLSGAGTVTLTGASVWSGGYMGEATQPGGTTIVDSGATLTIPGGAFTYLEQRTLTNNGTIVYTPATQYLTLQSASTVNNAGTFDIQSDQLIYIGGAGPNVFNNTGTLQKSAGAGTSAIHARLDHGGTVASTSGTLSFVGGGSSTGAFSAGAGSKIQFASNYTLNSGSTFAGTGGFQVSFGNLVVPAAASVTIPNFSILNGSSYLSGAGTVTLTGTATWAGGGMGHSSSPGGTTIVDSTGTLNIDGSGGFATLDQGRTLTNNGTIQYSAVSNYLSIYNGSTINNANSFNIATDQQIYAAGSGPNVISNTGTFQKTSGAATSIVNPQLNNSGTIATVAGSLSINGGGTSSGIFSAGAGTNIDFASTYTASAGSSFTGTGNFRINNGNLIVPGAALVSIPNLTLASAGSYLSGAGTVTLTGAATWTAGSMGSTAAPGGTTIIDLGATLAINGSYVYLDQARTLTSNGTINYAPVGGYLSISNGSTLNNAGTFNFQNGQGIVASGTGTNSFNNSGTAEKLSASGPSNITAVLNNSGSVMATSGVLALNGGGTHSGTFSAGAGATLTFGGGTHAASAVSTMAGSGTIEFSGGIADIAGTYNVSGTTRVSGGTARFNATASTAVLDLSGGILGGAGTFTVTTSGTWSGGNMNGPGTTIIDPLASLTMGGTTTYSYLDAARVLTNSGTIVYAPATYYLSQYGGSTINNGGLFDVQTNQGIAISGAGNAFNNSGTLRKSIATGASNFGVAVNNTGLVDVVTGTLLLQGGGTASGAFTFAVNSPANLDFASTYIVSNGGSFTGSGGFRINSGNLVIATAAAVTIPNLSLLTGSSYLSGGGTVTLTGTATWAAGSMGHSSNPGGTTIIDSTATLNLTNVSYKYVDQGRTLTNNGTINYNVPVYYLSIYNGSTLANAGTFDIQSDTGVSWSGAGSAFNNSGILQKTGGTGVSDFTVQVNNSGSVSVSTGTLSFSGGGTHSGAFAPSGSATLRFGGGTHTSASGTYSGSGRFAFTGGNVTLSGTTSYSAATTQVDNCTVVLNINGDTVSLDQSNGYLGGSGTFTITGSATWSGGTWGAPSATGGTTVINPAATVLINGATTYSYLGYGRTLNNNGTVTYTAPIYYLTFYQNGTLNNAGTFDVQTSQGLSLSGAGSLFSNSGTLQKTAGTGVSAISVPVNNNGSVLVSAGTLSFSGAGTHTGSFTATSPGTVQFNGGTHSSTAGSYGGTGTFLFANGNVTLSGTTTYSATATRVTSGTAVLNVNGSTVSLDQSNGYLGGSGTFTITGSATWSGGTWGELANTGGTTVINPGVTVLINGATTYSYLGYGRTLNNNGTITYTAPIYYLSFYQNGTLNNAGMFDIQTSQGISLSGAGSLFSNSGTLQKTAGSGVSAVSVPLNNNGSLLVSAGTLSFSGAGTHTGSFTVTSPGTVQFNGGTHSSTAGSYGGTGTFVFANGNVTLSGTATYSATATRVTSGTAVLNVNASTVSLDQSNGYLGGSGTFTITGSATWSGGTWGELANTGGTIIVNPGVTVLVNGATTYSYLGYGRTLNNNGTITYTAPTYYLTFYQNGTLNNAGTFDVQTSQGLSLSGAGSLFSNSGTLQKTAGTGVSAISVPVNNNGSVLVSAGTLSFSGAGTHTGSFNATSPGTVQFNGGAHSSTTGSYGGTGTFVFANGNVTLSGTTTYSAAATRVNNGTAVFNVNATTSSFDQTNGYLGGTGTFTITGPATWSGGTWGEPGNPGGTTVIDPGASVLLNGATTYSYLGHGRTLNNNGTITYSAPTYFLYFYLGGTLNNIGTMDVQSDQGFAVSGASNQLNNSGTFQKSGGAATSTFSVPFSNSGVVSALSGISAFNGGYTQTAGTLMLNGGGVSSTTPLNIQGGTVGGTGTIAAAVSNSGGAVKPGLSAGMLTISGNYTQGAAGVLEAEIASATSSDRLAISGTATLGGTLNVVNTGGYTPANGAGFQIVTYSTRSGDFATKNGLSYVGGAYTYNLNATDITLTAGSTADVTVSKTAPATVAINQTFAYTIVVSNLSSIDAATDVTLTDNLSAAGVVLSSITAAAGWTCAGTTTVTCTTTLLGPSSSASFTLNVTAPGSAGSITNTASVASVNEPATNNSNNSSAATTSVVTVQADVSVTVTSVSSTTAGNPIVYTVTANNAGPVSATNVVVTASIPSGVTAVSFTTSPTTSCTPSGLTATCTFASIGAGASASITISTTAADGGSMTVSATASASEPDPNTSNNSGSSTTIVTGSSTLVVRVTADSGSSSLRQAFMDAQSGVCVAPCTITFAIPGAGPHLIALLTQLPTGTVSFVTIDGTTQPGYSGAPLVHVDGSALSPGSSGFYVLGSDWTVRGIALHSVPGYGMFFSGGSGHIVADNYVGTNGSSDLGNLYDGLLFGNGSASNIVRGNVISGNTGSGIRIFGVSSGNLIFNNRIGVAADGSTPLANSNHGIYFQTGATGTVGGLAPAYANVIASNGTHGVLIDSGISGVEVLGNKFAANGGLAIDDSAGSGAPPTPSIASAELGGGNLHVTLSADATAVVGTAALRLEVYQADSLASAEGSQLLTSVCLSGNLLTNTVITVPAGSTVAGTPIVATATPYSGPSCTGITANTSEFSTAVAAAACTPPAVTIAASGPTAFCAPGTVTLTANPAGLTYLWSTGATTQSITVSATGTYTVTATNSFGCAASTSQSVTSNPVPPTPVIAASSPTTFCAGGSVTLTAPASASYLWSNGATTQSITATASGSYSVTVTNASGCSASSAPVSVTVNPLPPAPTITASGPTTFCQGGSVTLTASAASSWLWSNGATTQSITVSAAGSYTVTVTDGNGCGATSSPTTVTLNAPPAATVTPSGPTTFCPGGSVVLTASSGASWLWSNGATTQSITVSGSGNYSVTVTATNGCTATSSPVAVVVSPPPPTPVITASGPTTFCAGGSVILTAPASASYLWSNGATTQSITATATGSYSVTVTNASGCPASSAPVSVAVNSLPPAPTITASGPTTFCQGGSVTLTASAGSSWLWSNGATTQSITVFSGGNYSVTVADGNGCTSTSTTMPITVTSPPIIRISGPSTLCGAGTATLTVEGSGISSVTWSTGATSTSITVSPTSTTTYSAVVVTGSCTTTVSHTITLSNAGPPVSISAPASVPALSTGNVASVPAGASETYSWSIFNGSITSGQGTPAITFTAGASGAVTLNVTVDSSGCPSNGTTTIAIESCATIPPALISPAPGISGAVSPVTFVWSAVAGAVDYEVWRVAAGSSPALVGTAASTSLTADVPSGSYSWYVTARLQQSCDPQRLTSTEVRGITVVPAANCPTLAPALLGPANGSSPFSPVVFDWNGVPEAIGYRVMVSLGGLPAIELDSTDGDTTELIAEVPVGSVSWWVEAIYPGCPPVASAIGEFRVELEDCAKHERARLISPSDNAVADSSAVTFTWAAVDGADGYAVWAVLDDGASKIGETLGATSLTAVVPSGRREWYVETLFEGCPSTESDHRFLVVPASANCSATPSELAAPAAGAVVSSPLVTFTWSSVSGAVLYELWLSVGNGAEALIGRTASTSITSEVPAGAITWFVRARPNGCPHVDSQLRELRYEPPTGCSTMVPMPLLPMDDGRPITSPVAFRWTAVPGATQYKLYLGRGASGVFEHKATTSVPAADAIAVSNGESRWIVEAIFSGCPSTRSSQSRFVAVPEPASCIDLAAPVISLPGQVSAGTPYTVQWTAVPGAESYLLTEFIGSSARTMTTTGQSAQFTYDNQSNAGHMYVYRVRGVDHDCDPAREGALSTELGVSILPRSSPESSALVGSQERVQHTIPLGPDRAGQTFTATAGQTWITISPSTGVVPPGGIDLVATADVTGLPLGTSIGSVSITFAGGAGSRQVTTSTGPVTTPISVSLVTPVTPTPKSTPPPDALIIPAVAHADGINAQFRSDVRVSNTSPQVMKYQLTFVPSGEAGITQGRQTTLDIEPGRTIALDDVLRSWFGTGDSSILGTLEIRPVTQSSSATSSAAARGLPNFVTFASSRTFNQTPNGTFGTYIAAIPFANFIGRSTDSTKSVLSMQQIAQSNVYRSNLGFVEGSGNPAELLVSVFASSGAKITDFPVSLTGGQHLQMNSFLATRGIQLDDGRLEVQVTSGTGRVTSYASVVNNATGDSLVVTPTTLGQTTSAKYVLPGVAELSGGVVWQTDMRLFNAGTQPVTAMLTLQSLNGSPQQQASVQLAAGEVKQLDRVLATLFGVANDGGALHITTEGESKLIATARTFRPAGDGANFGQFIQAVTPDQAIALGSRPLQLLQVEESPRFRSNVGIAEVSGRPARVELTVIPPDSKVSAKIEVDLAANQFRQLNSLLSAMGLQGTHNARVTVKVIGGQGRVTAYAATIDALTQDPTFIPAQ